MATQAWILLCCLFLSAVTLGQGRRLSITVERDSTKIFCASVQCTLEADDETDGTNFNTRKIAIFDITQRNTRALVASLPLGESFSINPSLVDKVNGSASISKYHAFVSLSIRDPKDCKEELFQCEVEITNSEGKVEVIQKSITSTISDDESISNAADKDCRCSIITYRFKRLTDMAIEADRGLNYAKEKENEFVVEFDQLTNDSRSTAEEITRLQHNVEVNYEAVRMLENNNRDIQEQIDKLRRKDATVTQEMELMRRNDQARSEDLTLLQNKDKEMEKQIRYLTQIDRHQGESINNLTHSQSVTLEDTVQLKQQDDLFDDDVERLKDTNTKFINNITELTKQDRNFEKEINLLRKNDKTINQGINALRKNDTGINRALGDLIKKVRVHTEEIAKLREVNTIIDEDLTLLRQGDNRQIEEISRLQDSNEVFKVEIAAAKSRNEDFRSKKQELVQTDASLQKQINDLKAKESSTHVEVTKLKDSRTTQNKLLTSLRVNNRILTEVISRHTINSSSLETQVNSIFNQHKVINEGLVALSLRVSNVESLIISSQVTTITRITTNLIATNCTRGMPYDSPNVGFMLFNSVHAICDTETDGGGWIVIQRRTSGNTDFSGNWNEYKNGFGTQNGDFYLGNEVIHNLTAQGFNEMRIDIALNRKYYYAQYSNFRVGDESSNYRLTVGGYHGTPGDAMAYHDGMRFTTKDRDNDVSSDNCAVKSGGGGWWYKSCYRANLNGLWGKNDSDGVIWDPLSNSTSLTMTEIKIRQVV